MLIHVAKKDILYRPLFDKTKEILSPYKFIFVLMNTSVKIVMCCLFFGFSSCISIKRYSTTGSGNETFDFVKAHLSAHEQTVEDPDALVDASIGAPEPTPEIRYIIQAA